MILSLSKLSLLSGCLAVHDSRSANGLTDAVVQDSEIIEESVEECYTVGKISNAHHLSTGMHRKLRHSHVHHSDTCICRQGRAYR